MDLKALRKIEEWNQTYIFNYNCMEINIDLSLMLAKKYGVSRRVFENYYKLGRQYQERENLYPDLSFAYCYARQHEYYKLPYLETEVIKYLNNLNLILKECGLLVPEIDEIDASSFVKGFALECVIRGVENRTSFKDYLNCIDNGTFCHLKNFTFVDKLDLKNPLFYILLLNSFAEFNRGLLKDSNKYQKTLLWYNEVLSIVRKNEDKLAS